MRLVDARAGRFEQAIVVVVLLAGFVFQQRWSIPIAAFIAGLGAVPWPSDRRSPASGPNVIARGVRPASPNEPASIAQSPELLLFVGLDVATLLLLAGSDRPGVDRRRGRGVVGALGATGVVNAAAEIRRRSSSR